MCSFSFLVAQKTSTSNFTNDLNMSSVGLATDLQEAFMLIDSVQVMLMDNYSIELYCRLNGFSSKDTIMELIQINSDNSYYKNGGLLLNISSGLLIDQYSKLLDYTAQMVTDTIYRTRWVYDEFTGALIDLYGRFVNIDYYPEDNSKEILSFYRKICICRIRLGDYQCFGSKAFREKCLDSEICEIIEKELIDNYLYSKHFEKEFLVNMSIKYDPVKYDTTGVPQRIKDGVTYSPWNKCSAEDQYYEGQWARFTSLNKIAIENNITLEQAFYQQEMVGKFGLVGYKGFSSMIYSLAMNNDNRLYEQIKKFLKEHTDYKIENKEVRRFYGLD